MAGTSPGMTRIAIDIADRSSLNVAGVDLLADLSGALFWESRASSSSPTCIWKKAPVLPRAACCAALRYRGDARAARRRDRAARSAHVIALGDSFHDRDAHQRLSGADRDALAAMQARRDWIWITGNHDPELPSDLGGVVAQEVAIGPLAFRHEATGAAERYQATCIPRRGIDARPLDGATPVFCLRRRACCDAGVWRLYRWPQHP